MLKEEEYFKTALEGRFIESSNQAMDFPEEDPTVFSFIVAWLYEHDFKPLVSASTQIVVDKKGKATERSFTAHNSPSKANPLIGGDLHDRERSHSRDARSQSDSDSLSDRSIRSNNSARVRSRRAAELRRRQSDLDAYYRKDITRHRPDCTCASCVDNARHTSCYNCGAPPPRRQPPPRRFHANGLPVHQPPPHMRPPGLMVYNEPFIVIEDHPRGRNGLLGRAGRRERGIQELIPEERMDTEDLRTWVAMYELSIDVYICAERYLMEGLKECVAIFLTDNFERAGMDAAQPAVLQSCTKLFRGVRESDEFVKRVFARTGFLLARLWRNYPQETHEWYMENSDVGVRLTKEMVSRREVDSKDDLPPMVRRKSPPRRDGVGSYGRGRYHHDIVLVDD